MSSTANFSPPSKENLATSSKNCDDDDDEHDMQNVEKDKSTTSLAKRESELPAASSSASHNKFETPSSSSKSPYHSIQETEKEENGSDNIITGKRTGENEEIDYNGIKNLHFDPELALMLEDHLKLKLPFKSPFSCCCPSETDEEDISNEIQQNAAAVENPKEITSQDEMETSSLPLDPKTTKATSKSTSSMRLSPSTSFLLFTLIFYVPIVWSSLKPIFFPPPVPAVGNFDSCSWLNYSSSLNFSNDQQDNEQQLLIPMKYIDCIRCNDERGYVRLQPALTSMTPFALRLILLRLFVAAAIGSWMFCRVYFERVLSVRLLAFGVLILQPPKRQYIPDLLWVLAVCMGISFQLAYLRSFAPPALNYVKLGVCNFASPNESFNFFNKTIVAHFNQTTVDSLYQVASEQSELFSFLSLLLPFLIGPIFVIFKQQNPLAHLDPTIAFGEKEIAEKFSKKMAEMIVEKAVQVRYLARVSLFRLPVLMIKRRGCCNFILETFLASFPFPVNYYQRLRRNHQQHQEKIQGEEKLLLENAVNSNDDHIDEERKKEASSSKKNSKSNLLRNFMEYELGKFSCEFYLISLETYQSGNYQKWLWFDCGVNVFIAIFLVVGFMSVIQPTLTYEQAVSEHAMWV